jgi:hypothetical protein
VLAIERGGRDAGLSPQQKAELYRLVVDGPAPEASGLSAFTREIWCAFARSGSATACT